jgi:MoxR-like ATPase
MTEETREMSASDIELAKGLKEAYANIKSELAKVIVGQDEVIDQLLISIFSRGHCILEGVPGLAKTLLISTLSETMSLSFNRIQFTPDLMPSDITGTEVIQENKSTGERSFKFIQGPIFANVILADEINRTPPKTQAALLEAMQEHQVSAGGTKHVLEEPFFVLATQNPIEQEGTYPLPEAQLDRFMFKIFVDYPSVEEEMEVMRLTTTTQSKKLETVLNGEDIVKLQEIVRRVPVSEHVLAYATSLVRATRVLKKDGVPDFILNWLSWGAGPRAAQYLILGGKARAILSGRHFVSTDDIKSVAHPVLRHRIITNFSADAEGITTDHVIDKLLETIDSKESELSQDGQVPKVFGSESLKQDQSA